MRSGKKGVGEGRSTTGDVEDEDEGEEEVEGQDGMVEEGGRVDRAAEKEKMRFVRPCLSTTTCSKESSSI